MRAIFIAYPLALFFIYPMFMIIEKQTLILVFLIIFIAIGGYADAKAYVRELAGYFKLKNSTVLRLAENNIRFIIVAVLMMSSLIYLKYSGFENTEKPIEHETAGYFLKETVNSGYEELNIMGRKPYVSFYSESRFTMLPYAGIADTLAFAKLYDVNYIVIDERSLSGWDYYDKLVDMHKYSDGVELVFEDSGEFLIKLFKIR